MQRNDNKHSSSYDLPSLYKQWKKVNPFLFTTHQNTPSINPEIIPNLAKHLRENLLGHVYLQDHFSIINMFIAFIAKDVSEWDEHFSQALAKKLLSQLAIDYFLTAHAFYQEQYIFCEKIKKDITKAQLQYHMIRYIFDGIEYKITETEWVTKKNWLGNNVYPYNVQKIFDVIAESKQKNAQLIDLYNKMIEIGIKAKGTKNILNPFMEIRDKQTQAFYDLFFAENKLIALPGEFICKKNEKIVTPLTILKNNPPPFCQTKEKKISLSAKNGNQTDTVTFFVNKQDVIPRKSDLTFYFSPIDFIKKNKRMLSVSETKLFDTIQDDLPEGRSTKKELNERFGINIDFSIIKICNDENKTYTIYSVYKGRDYNTLLGEATVKVKFIQNIETLEPAVLKIFVPTATRPQILNEKMAIREDHALNYFSRKNHGIYSRISSKNKSTQYEVIMDFISGEPLPLYWNAEKDKLSFNDIKIIIEGMVDEVKILHDKDILHCDIKPENYLIEDKSGNHKILKLIDYGFILKAPKELANTDFKISDILLGTRFFMAPELLLEAKKLEGGSFFTSYSKKSDIFALGISIAKLLNIALQGYVCTNSSLVYNQSKLEIINKLSLSERSTFLPLEDMKKIVEFLTQVIDSDPEKRPSLNTIKNFFNELNYEKTEELKEEKLYSNSGSMKK